MWISDDSKHDSNAGGSGASGRPRIARRLPSRNMRWVADWTSGSRRPTAGTSSTAFFGACQASADPSSGASSGATSSGALVSGHTAFSAVSTVPIGIRSCGRSDSSVRRVPIALRFLSISGA
jgi:hypothetical protein